MDNGLQQSAQQEVENVPFERQEIEGEKGVQSDDGQKSGSEGPDDGKDEEPRC